MPFKDNDTKYEAGDTWLLKGPATYVPRQEVNRVKKQQAIIIERECGLLLECIKERKSSKHDNRKAGEKWLEKNPGFYHINADEKYIKYLKPQILTQTTALQLRSTKTYKDI